MTQVVFEDDESLLPDEQEQIVDVPASVKLNLPEGRILGEKKNRAGNRPSRVAAAVAVEMPENGRILGKNVKVDRALVKEILFDDLYKQIRDISAGRPSRAKNIIREIEFVRKHTQSLPDLLSFSGRLGGAIADFDNNFVATRLCEILAQHYGVAIESVMEVVLPNGKKIGVASDKNAYFFNRQRRGDARISSDNKDKINDNPVDGVHSLDDVVGEGVSADAVSDTFETGQPLIDQDLIDSIEQSRSLDDLIRSRDFPDELKNLVEQVAFQGSRPLSDLGEFHDLREKVVSLLREKEASLSTGVKNARDFGTLENIFRRTAPMHAGFWTFPESGDPEFVSLNDIKEYVGARGKGGSYIREISAFGLKAKIDEILQNEQPAAQNDNSKSAEAAEVALADDKNSPDISHADMLSAAESIVVNERIPKEGEVITPEDVRGFISGQLESLRDVDEDDDELGRHERILEFGVLLDNLKEREQQALKELDKAKEKLEEASVPAQGVKKYFGFLLTSNLGSYGEELALLEKQKAAVEEVYKDTKAELSSLFERMKAAGISEEDIVSERLRLSTSSEKQNSEDSRSVVEAEVVSVHRSEDAQFFDVEGFRKELEGKGLEELGGILSEARREYAQADYVFKKNPKNEKLNQEKSVAWEKYSVVLEYYRKAAAVGAEGKSEKEVLDILEKNGFNEFSRLYEERIKAEAKPWAIKSFTQLGERYRSLNWKTKLACSGAVLALGLSGGAVPVAAATLGAVGLRAASTASASVGTFQFLEAWMQGKREKEDRKRMSEMGNDFKVDLGNITRVDDWFQKLESGLAQSHGDLDKRLQEVMKNRRKQAMAAGLMGTFVAMGGPGTLFHSLSDWVSDVLPQDSVDSFKRWIDHHIVSSGNKLVTSLDNRIPNPEVVDRTRLEDVKLNPVREEPSRIPDSLEDKLVIPPNHVPVAADEVKLGNAKFDAVREAPPKISGSVKIEPGSGKGLIQTLAEQLEKQGGMEHSAARDEASRLIFNHAHEHHISVDRWNNISGGELKLGVGPDGRPVIESLHTTPLKHVIGHSAGVHHRVELPEASRHATAVEQPIAHPATDVAHVKEPLSDSYIPDKISRAEVGTLEHTDSEPFSENPHSPAEALYKRLAGSVFEEKRLAGVLQRPLSEAITSPSVPSDIQARLLTFASSSSDVLGRRFMDDMYSQKEEGWKTVARIIRKAAEDGKKQALLDSVSRKLSAQAGEVVTPITLEKIF